MAAMMPPKTAWSALTAGAPVQSSGNPRLGHSALNLMPQMQRKGILRLRTPTVFSNCLWHLGHCIGITMLSRMVVIRSPLSGGGLAVDEAQLRRYAGSWQGPSDPAMTPLSCWSTLLS